MRIGSYRVRRSHLLIVAGAGCVVPAIPVSADIVDARIVRRLDAEAVAVSGDDRVFEGPEPIISDDFGLFDRAHDASAQTHDERASAGGLATQETFAEVDSLNGRLFTSVVAHADGPEAESASSGASEANYTFTLTDGARFALEGDYIVRDDEGGFDNLSSIVLIPLDNEDVEPILIDDPGHFQILGRLPAGAYRVEAQTAGRAEAFKGTSSLVAVIEFRFALSECPADITADGELDADDFFAFLDLFAEDDPSVDFNHDERIDSDDFFAYLDLFVEGCG